LPKQHFSNDAANGPDVDYVVVFSRTKNKFWSSVVARANVRHVDFTTD
jgi:hypothetical protein